MADEKHLTILKQGVEVWNKWREKNPDIRPDLITADLREANLSHANLEGANLEVVNLTGANLSHTNLFNADLIFADLIGANLNNADLSNADLSEADLSNADLREADLSNTNLIRSNLSHANLKFAYLHNADLREANLSNANLIGSIFSEANLSYADLRNADLSYAELSNCKMVETKLNNSDLTGCKIYGISAWNIETNENTKQSNLVITRLDEPTITVDNLEIAQFIYLMVNNKKIRDVISTIGKKVVLILGRFTPARKPVLDAIRESLREKDYIPVLFDFVKPVNRSIIETVSTLAHLSRFIIVDLTTPKVILQELTHIVPRLAVPIKPIIQGKRREVSTIDDLRRNAKSVLKTFRYIDINHLINSLDIEIIKDAEEKAKEFDNL